MSALTITLSERMVQGVTELPLSLDAASEQAEVRDYDVRDYDDLDDLVDGCTLVEEADGERYVRYFVESDACLDSSVRQAIRAALEGDSNDDEHDALVLVADAIGVQYDLLEWTEN